MHELFSQSKIVLSKKYSTGSIYVIEMIGDMFAVLGFSSEEEEPIYSRAFFFNEKTKKNILKQARNCFKQVKECFFQNNLELLDTLD